MEMGVFLFFHYVPGKNGFMGSQALNNLVSHSMEYEIYNNKEHVLNPKSSERYREYAWEWGRI